MPVRPRHRRHPTSPPPPTEVDLSAAGRRGQRVRRPVPAQPARQAPARRRRLRGGQVVAAVGPAARAGPDDPRRPAPGVDDRPQGRRRDRTRPGPVPPLRHHRCDDALDLLTEFRDSMLDRQEWMRDHRVRALRRSAPDTPYELLVIDELAMLTAYGDRSDVREALRLLAEILTQGRAADHGVAGYVQEPSKDVVDVRELFTTRICLGVTAASHVDMVLGDGARDRGALADEIPGDPGTPGSGSSSTPAPGSRSGSAPAASPTPTSTNSPPAAHPAADVGTDDGRRDGRRPALPAPARACYRHRRQRGRRTRRVRHGRHRPVPAAPRRRSPTAVLAAVCRPRAALGCAAQRPRPPPLRHRRSAWSRSPLLVGAARWVARRLRERREDAADALAGAAWRAQHMPGLAAADRRRPRRDRVGVA